MRLNVKSAKSSYRPLVWLSTVGSLWFLFQPSTFSLLFGCLVIIFWIEFFFTKNFLLNLVINRFTERNRAFVNQEFKIIYTIASNMSGRFVIELIPSLYGNTPSTKISGKKLSVSNGKKTKIEFDLSFSKRGIKDVSNCTIFYTDPLGLFKHWINFGATEKIIILPDIMDIENFPSRLRELLPGSTSDFKLLEDLTRIRGVREYNFEALNKIHWKISAKLGKLYVKEHDYTAIGNIKFYVDLNLSNEIHAKNVWSQIREFYQEDAIKAACAVVYSCYLKGNHVDLTVIGEKVLKVENTKDWVKIVELLAMVQGTNNGPQIDEVLIKEIEKLTPSSTLVIMSMFLTNSILPLLLKARARCAKVLVIIMPYGFRDPKYKPGKDYSLYPRDMEKLLERARVLENEQIIVRIIRANQSFQEVLSEIE
jgi:uncharacterized protein (DUF58 family)